VRTEGLRERDVEASQRCEAPECALVPSREIAGQSARAEAAGRWIGEPRRRLDVEKPAGETIFAGEPELAVHCFARWGRVEARRRDGASQIEPRCSSTVPTCLPRAAGSTSTIEIHVNGPYGSVATVPMAGVPSSSATRRHAEQPSGRTASPAFVWFQCWREQSAEPGGDIVLRHVADRHAVGEGHRVIIGWRMEVPAAIRDVAHLEQLLSEPSGAAVEAMRRANGDVIVLGAAGIDGTPRLASGWAGARSGTWPVCGTVSSPVSPLRIFDQQRTMEGYGVETIRCDLLDEPALARLPDAPQRGLHGRPEVRIARQRTAHVGHERTSSCPCLRRDIAAVESWRSRPGTSTVSRRLARGGSREEDLPAPIGEYAMKLSRARTHVSSTSARRSVFPSRSLD